MGAVADTGGVIDQNGGVRAGEGKSGGHGADMRLIDDCLLSFSTAKVCAGKVDWRRMSMGGYQTSQN